MLLVWNGIVCVIWDMFPAVDLYCSDAAQHGRTAGWDVDDLDHDLSRRVKIVHRMRLLTLETFWLLYALYALYVLYESRVLCVVCVVRVVQVPGMCYALLVSRLLYAACRLRCASLQFLLFLVSRFTCRRNVCVLAVIPHLEPRRSSFRVLPCGFCGGLRWAGVWVALGGFPRVHGVFSKVTFEEEPWKSVSNNAKDFILKLLRKDPRKRLTAQQASAQWLLLLWLLLWVLLLLLLFSL